MSSETEYVMTLFIFSLKWFIPEACAMHLINQHVFFLIFFFLMFLYVITLYTQIFAP